MDTGLADKVVLITGAAGGIGREIANAFAAEGAALALCAHTRAAELARLAAEAPWGERALLLRADVTSAAECEAACEAARARFGRIDACVANAGVWPPEDVPLHAQSEERLRRTLEVDLLGAAFTARAFLQCLAKTGPRADGHGAALLLIGSTAGRFGERGHADYAMAKSGLRGLLLSVKNEIAALDPHARANLIEPGWTVTAMVRPILQQDEVLRRVVGTMALRQLARAQDIASAAVFLASPLLARHISGEILGVSGGMEGRKLWNDADIDPGELRARLSRE